MSLRSFFAGLHHAATFNTHVEKQMRDHHWNEAVRAEQDRAIDIVTGFAQSANATHWLTRQILIDVIRKIRDDKTLIIKPGSGK